MDISIEDLPVDFEDLDLPGPSGVSKPVKDIKDVIADESESDDNNYSNDSEEEVDDKPSTKKKLVIKNVSRLTPHLKGLMGEANLRFARGDYETAKKMCFEVIRQAADSYEPYLTLAQIYENNNLKKYKAYLMLASHLYPRNVSIWCRLAEINIQEGFLGEAVKCYSAAISAEPKNIALHKKRVALVEEKCGPNAVLRFKEKMAEKMPRKQYETIIKICMDVAKEFFKEKHYARAIKALKVPITRVPEHVTQDLLNMILECLLCSERFSECLDIFTQFCGFAFDITVIVTENFQVNSYTMPENLEIDLKVKFIICMVRLRCYPLVSCLIDQILVEVDIENCGDIYLDIAEALMTASYHQEALKLTVPLVKSKNFSLAAVWLKHAECLNACGMLEQATEAYFTVMTLAPNHVEVLYPLAMLLLKQNKKEEALEVLAQDLSKNRIDVAVMIEQMKLLKQIGDLEVYWKCCELLLSRHCIILKSSDEVRFITTRRYNDKLAKIKKLRQFKGESGDDVEPTLESIREPSIEEEYKIFREMLQFAFDRKEYKQCQKFAFMGLGSKRFQKYFDEIYIFCYYSSLFARDSYYEYKIIRDIAVRYSNNALAWNWFCLIMQSPDDIRHTRFLERYLGKHSRNKKLIYANYACSVGNYFECLSTFLEEYKQTNSLYALFMLGIAMSQTYCQRNLPKSVKKQIAETVTYIFLNYAKRRSKHALNEAYYNVARMYHQIGISYLAELYYKKVLDIKETEISIKYNDTLGLKEEAAYNLHLIYKQSGNFVAARKVLMENIII